VSLRDNFLAVRSIDSLRRVIASKNSELYSELAARYDKVLLEEYGDADDLDEAGAADLKDHREEIATALDQIIMSDQPPAIEHGDWVGAFELIAELLGIEICGKFPINGYKHHYTWGPYRERIHPQISADVDRLLSLLDSGRPLLGTSMESDWTMYAWLSGDEIACLHDALVKVAVGDDDGSGLAEFHKDLLASLKLLCKKGAELLMVAD
jgi:hypothetical protein